MISIPSWIEWDNTLSLPYSFHQLIEGHDVGLFNAAAAYNLNVLKYVSVVY
jgi:hypothetical protein